MEPQITCFRPIQTQYAAKPLPLQLMTLARVRSISKFIRLKTRCSHILSLMNISARSCCTGKQLFLHSRGVSNKSGFDMSQWDTWHLLERLIWWNHTSVIMTMILQVHKIDITYVYISSSGISYTIINYVYVLGPKNCLNAHQFWLLNEVEIILFIW